jgi:predicted Zn-dependent peptidase
MSKDYKKTVLKNGLKVISRHMPERSSLALGIWISVGGRYESFKFKGIAHFLEHVIFKGTKKYPCYKLKELIEGVGGSLNGFTSEELTCYLVKIPSQHAKLAVDILSDMVLNPLLPENEIEKERQVILEEIKMYKDQPQSYVYDLLDELLWPNQPLGLPIIGMLDSISKIKRLELKSFKERYYTPSNIVISAAGCLKHEELLEQISRLFFKDNKNPLNIFAAVNEKQLSPQMKVSYKDTEQTHLTLGFHGLARDHRLRHALSMLHIILGANMSSRLFNEVREKRGLAYEIGTLVKRFQDTGAFIIHAGVDNKNPVFTIELILEQLDKIKRKPVTRDEFKRAKEFYLGQLMLALEDTLEQMLWIGETTITLDKIYSLEQIIREVNKVDIQDILETAKYIFKDRKMNLALIGPLKERDFNLADGFKLG